MSSDTRSIAGSPQQRADSPEAESGYAYQPPDPHDRPNMAQDRPAHQTERELSNEDIRRLILETSLDGFWITDMKGKLLEVNNAYCRLIGYSREELLAMSISDIQAKETHEEISRHIQIAIQQGYNRFESRHCCKDGRIIDVEISANYLDVENGRFFVFIRDVTERRNALELLKKKEARLQTLVHILQQQCETIEEFLDHALQAAIRLTESGIGYIFFYSEEEEKFNVHAWSRDAMDTCSIIQPLTMYQLEETGIWGEAVRQRKEIMVNDFNAPHPLKKGYPDGHPPLNKFLTVPVFNGERIVAVVGVANKQQNYTRDDVLQLKLLMDGVWKALERKQAETALIENESLLALSQKIAHLGSWKLDLTANRLTWSDEAYRIFGCSPQEFAATYEAFIDIVHPEDRSAVDTTYAQSLKDTSAGYEIEHRIVRKDTGDVRYVHEQCIHEQDATGAIIQSIGIVQDITERKQAEMNQLEHIQELQRWHAATMGRESRVLELKREVNELLRRAGQPVRYPSATIG